MLRQATVTTFTNNDVNPGDVVLASHHNEQGSRIATVLNGGIDNDNINASAAIAGSKLADGSVTAAKLGYSTIRLGSATRTSSFATTAAVTSPAQVTDMSISFTLTEAHVVQFTFVAQSLNNSGTNFNVLYICQGSADDANSVGSWRYQSTGNGNEVPVNLITEVALNAGSYTFVVAAGTNGGTLTIVANTTGTTGMPMRFTADIVG